jgi:hypothetical protein
MVELSPTFRAPSAFRRSVHINRKPAANIWHAFNMAEDRGLPFTVVVTLNFSHTACVPDAVSAQFRTLLNRHFAPWWRRPSRKDRSGGPPGPYAWIWVLEHGAGQLAVHWVLHLPKSRWADFAKRLPDWLEAVSGGITNQNAIDLTAIYNPAGLRKYVLKGAEPAYAAFCKIEHEPQGEVIGRRSDFSRTLGPTARHRANYKSRRYGRVEPGTLAALPRDRHV